MELWWNRGGTLVERSAELPRSPKFICHRKPQKVRNPFCPEALTIAEELFAIGGKHCTILGIQNCVIMFTFRFCSTVAREKAMENICLPCADSALEAGILKYRVYNQILHVGTGPGSWKRTCFTMEEKNASDPSDPLMSNQFPNPGLPHNLVIVEM